MKKKVREYVICGVLLFLGIILFLLVKWDVHSSIIEGIRGNMLRNSLYGKIVFSEGTTLRVLDVRTGEIKEIYRSDSRLGENISNPCWAPDGSKIVFVRKYIKGGIEEAAKWFIDGKKGEPPVLQQLQQDLYLIQSDGKGMKELVHMDSKEIYSPSWSPDGNEIAFVVKDNEAFCIYKIGVRDYIPQQVTGSIRGFGGLSSWSLDNKKIFFRTVEGKDRIIISSVNADGTNLVNLITIEGAKAVWSPDNKKIAYYGKGGLYTVDADGKNPKRIVTLSIGAEQISWSPDGEHICFNKSAQWYRSDLIVASLKNPRGKARIARIEGAGFLTGFSWVK